MLILIYCVEAIELYKLFHLFVYVLYYFSWPTLAKSVLGLVFFFSMVHLDASKCTALHVQMKRIQIQHYNSVSTCHVLT